jgi:hypothetical protein
MSYSVRASEARHLPAQHAEIDLWTPPEPPQQPRPLPPCEQLQQHEFCEVFDRPEADFRPLPPYSLSTSGSTWTTSTHSAEDVFGHETASDPFDLFHADRWPSDIWTSGEASFPVAADPAVAAATTAQRLDAFPSGRSFSGSLFHVDDAFKSGHESAASTVAHSRSNSVPSDMYFLSPNSDVPSSFNFAQ